MKKKNIRGWGFRLVNAAVLGLVALMTLYPFLYVSSHLSVIRLS